MVSRFLFRFLLPLTAVALVAVVAMTAIRVRHALRPPRNAEPVIDLEAVKVPVEEVTFPSVDGVELAGWYLAGRADRPPILLCHDFGEGKDAMLNLGLALNAQGFATLQFDFRGHGDSPQGRSTLGLEEKRDVLGAIDFLAERHRQGAIGVYGVGMGAHAAVLAAPDRRRMRVLVLDGLYPDAGYPLVRGVWADWGIGVRRLRFLPDTLFFLMNGRRVGSERAIDVLARLEGRDLLMLAPAGDSDLVGIMEEMVAGIPEQPDHDGNLVVLPATQSAGLFGEDVARHRARVEGFFTDRLH